MNNANRLLAVVIVLQVLILSSLWLGHSVPQAQAQIPDPGAQRKETVDELKALNTKLEKLTDLLASGKLQVVVQKSDQK
jgi:hypothetical protein